MYSLGYDPNYFYGLTFSQKITFISSFNTINLLKLTVISHFPPLTKDHPYDANHLNSNGDMTYYSSKQQKTTDELAELIDDTIFTEDPVTDDARDELSDFIEYCHDNNIAVYAAWPCFLYGKKEFSERDLEGIKTIENFYQEHNVEILGNYTDCLYDTEYFYDTTYHLNDKGKALHTDYLINMLQEKIPR